MDYPVRNLISSRLPGFHLSITHKLGSDKGLTTTEPHKSRQQSSSNYQVTFIRMIGISKSCSRYLRSNGLDLRPETRMVITYSQISRCSEWTSPLSVLLITYKTDYLEGSSVKDKIGRNDIRLDVLKEIIRDRTDHKRLQLWASTSSDLL